jgi:hypothetical protein
MSTDSNDHDHHGEKNGGQNGMTISYPIVAQYELDDPVKRGPLGLGKRRENTEIPKIKPHEVLVWRVGARYVVDRRELRAHDDAVVRASSVSIVSVRPGTEVTVSFRVDSRDSLEFTVKVTFICSVVDPVVVVRDGQVNAADALLAYLRGYQDLFQLGLGHPVAEVNRVRTEMAFQVKAYMARLPPKIPGIAITSATVQVQTPATLGKMREIDSEQEIALAKKMGEARIAEKWQEHILAKAKMTSAIRQDPREALIYAHAEGGVTSQEVAEQLQHADEAREQRDQLNRLADRTRRYELEDRDAERDRDKALWKRQQKADQRKEDREDRRGQVSANIELLKMFADRGYLDTYNADIEDLIRRIRGDDPAPPVAARDQRSELAEGREPEDDNDN